MSNGRSVFGGVLAALIVAACGGSSGGAAAGGPPPPNPSAISSAEAFRFLNQASFGATPADARAVQTLGYAGWIDDQMQQIPSRQLPHLLSLPKPELPPIRQPDRVDIWFRNSIDGSDQLRQRVAFALSEILVVSQIGALLQAPYALADYYDKLAQGAFGNYRDLLETVTLHPAMGVYLSMLGNEKPDAARNIRPDENYARELMQLFSIGLVELNLDGTVRLDADDRPVPTYDQQVIEGFAHVFTGWNYSGFASWEEAVRTDENQVLPMQLYPAFHDTGPKTLLDGVVVPAGQSGQQDLALALDTIFNHPNVAPFVAIRLIQRLTTSNPSPAYVQRVASVFNDNGAGVRGDLGAVVRAILLDDEARTDRATQVDGKLKEPLLRLTQFWRAYDGRSQSGIFPLVQIHVILGQGPLQSNSVFNFFSPFHAPAGEIRDNGFVAPELEIATEFQNTYITNYFFVLTFNWNSEKSNPGPDEVLIDISEELALARDTDALVDLVADKLLAGEISDLLRARAIEMVDETRLAMPGNDAAVAAEAIFFIVTSPEFAGQR